jgi:hypothetical protein
MSDRILDRERSATARGFASAGTTASAPLARFASELAAALGETGLAAVEPRDAGFVVLLVDRDRPRPFRRGSRGTFVAALFERPPVTDGLLADYPMLVRALANVAVAYVPGEGAWITTMERGHYRVSGPTDRLVAAGVVERLGPLAGAKLVIDNDFQANLEPELWAGDELTEEIRRAGVRLGSLGLLPSPFPIEDLLGERELRHIKRLYGIGGLSYGNLSARKDERRFWMSASGVDKTHLDVPGRDILLVSDYDADRPAIVVSVPPGVEPRRVSVDAIEHWMIYQEHPDVGAILHVHAWVDGIAATEINYPCGSEELALSVAGLVSRAPDPGAAVVGLRNHGITATGRTLGGILDRLAPVLTPQVPMA